MCKNKERKNDRRKRLKTDIKRKKTSKNILCSKNDKIHFWYYQIMTLFQNYWGIAFSVI